MVDLHIRGWKVPLVPTTSPSHIPSRELTRIALPPCTALLFDVYFEGNRKTCKSIDLDCVYDGDSFYSDKHWEVWQV